MWGQMGIDLMGLQIIQSGLKFITQPGVDVLSGRVGPAHLGVVVDLGVQVLGQPHGDVGRHYRKVPLGRVGLEVEGAAPLAEAGVEALAAVGKFVWKKCSPGALP